MSDIQIHNADVRTCLDAITAARFAACITDPPYCAAVHDRATSVGYGAPVKRDLGFACLDEHTRIAIARVAASCARWTAVFSDVETSHKWSDALVAEGLERIRVVPWLRWSQPQLSGDRPPSGCELITLAHPKGRKHWSGPGSLTGFDTRSLRGREKYSCEKPLDLMLSLVSWFSDAGESIVDPCCGSGTTGLAARLLERDALLLDLDADACSIARSRVGGALTDRDRERCERWVEYQAHWLEGEVPDSEAGAARYARAMADTKRVVAALRA